MLPWKHNPVLSRSEYLRPRCCRNDTWVRRGWGEIPDLLGEKKGDLDREVGDLTETSSVAFICLPLVKLNDHILNGYILLSCFHTLRLAVPGTATQP